jgi:hypothetical protein
MLQRKPTRIELRPEDKEEVGAAPSPLPAADGAQGGPTLTPVAPPAQLEAARKAAQHNAGTPSDKHPFAPLQVRRCRRWLRAGRAGSAS